MNILFITADQWRGECLSALGHPHLRTPNLDALAADGVIFKRHYAQAVPCGPSRTCLYTGMYMHNHRSLLNGTPLDSRHTNIALEARKCGYRPVLFGYNDVSLDPRSTDVSKGAEKAYEGVLPGMDAVTLLNSDRALWLADLEAKGYEIPENPMDIFKPQAMPDDAPNRGKTFAPARYKAQDSHTAFLVDQAVNYLSDCHDDPWFVHLSFYSPHPPFVVPAPYNEMYCAEDMPLPVRRDTMEQEAAQHPWLRHYLFNQSGSPYTIGTDARDNHTLSDLELRQIRATYYGMMSEVDAQIGRLMDHLKQTGSYDDTLIIFTSDHGEQLGDHWAFSKYCYFDETFHVPLIIRDPRPQARQSCHKMIDAFTETIDIMPTILEAISADIPHQCDGHSLLPFSIGESPPDWRQEYHAEFDLRSPYDGEGEIPLGLDMEKCITSIISDERYKYVHFTDLPPLFFDHKEDRDEFTNRYSDPACQQMALEYAGKMISWRMQHDDAALTDMHLTEDGLVHNMRSKKQVS